jgi:hypothetical protein
MADGKELDASRMVMRPSTRFGKDKNGATNVATWQTELGLAAAGHFGDLAVVFNGEKHLWMDPHARFVYTVAEKDRSGTIRRVQKPFPKEADDPEEYRYAVKDRDEFEDYQKRFKKAAPQMITFLTNGTMQEDTRDRVMDLISARNNPILKEIKDSNDILRLKGIIERAWDFKGATSDDNDKKKAEAAFRKFGEDHISHGKNIQEHKREFDEHIRKLTSLGSLGNRDSRDDSFTQKGLFDAFTDPLRTHFHKLVRDRVDQYAQCYHPLNKDDPEEIHREFQMFQSLEKKENISMGGKVDKAGYNNNSVHTTKEVKEPSNKGKKGSPEKGSVNSAQQSVNRAVNKQIENKNNKAQRGPFVSEETHPKSWQKLQGIMKRDKCTLIEAIVKTKCDGCGMTGHIKDECNVSKDNKGSHSGGKKKKFFKKKANVVDGKESEVSSDEDIFGFGFCARGVEIEGPVRRASPPHPELASDDDMPILVDNSDTESDDEMPPLNNVDPTRPYGMDLTADKGDSSDEESANGLYDDMCELISNSDSSSDDESPVPRVVVSSSPGFNPGETRDSREMVAEDVDSDSDIPNLEDNSDWSEEDAELMHKRPSSFKPKSTAPKKTVVTDKTPLVDKLDAVWKILGEQIALNEIDPEIMTEGVLESKYREIINNIYGCDDWDSDIEGIEAGEELFNKDQGLVKILSTYTRKLFVCMAPADDEENEKDKKIRTKQHTFRSSGRLDEEEEELVSKLKKQHWSDELIQRRIEAERMFPERSGISEKEYVETCKPPDPVLGQRPYTAAIQLAVNSIDERERLEADEEAWSKSQSSHQLIQDGMIRASAELVLKQRSESSSESDKSDDDSNPPDANPPPVSDGSSPGINPGETHSGDEVSKKPRFGFVEVDGKLGYFDDDWVIPRAIIAKEWDDVQEDIRKLSIEEDWVDVEGLSDSGSEGSDYYRDADFWSGCHMAKMKKHLRLEEKRQEISEAIRYCLDGMANVNVIRNPNVLYNIRDSGKVMRIVGIGGKQIEISKVGDHPLFGKCWYYPQNEFNIISQWKANEQGLMFRVSEDNEQAWLVREDVSELNGTS